MKILYLGENQSLSTTLQDTSFDNWGRRPASTTLHTRTPASVYYKLSNVSLWSKEDEQTEIKQLKPLSKNPTSSLNSRIISMSPVKKLCFPIGNGRELQIIRSYNNSSLKKHPDLSSTLSRTKVSPEQRTRMIDWIVEVLNSFKEKSSSPTIFRAIMIMDLFLKYHCEATVSDSDVHIIGVAAMFIASKYEDIYHISLNEIYKDVVYMKFSKKEILREEACILHTLGFKFSSPTLLEYIYFHSYKFCRTSSWQEEPTVNLSEKACYVAELVIHFSNFNNYGYDFISLMVLVFVLKHVKIFDYSVEKLRARYESNILSNSKMAFAYEREILANIFAFYIHLKTHIDELVHELRNKWDYLHFLIPNQNLRKFNQQKIEFVEKF